MLGLIVGCDPSDEETNIYRKGRYFPGGINVPVASLISEWAGKVRVMGSAWLIDGGNGALFSAKHVTDAFMGNIVELGGSECKVFLSGKIYDCTIARVPPLRDAVVLNISSPFKLSELPKPYKIAETKVKLGDQVFIQGLHLHSLEIRELNKKEGFGDFVVPIFKTFYGRRFGNKCNEREEVFHNIEAKVTALDVRIKIDDQENDPMGGLKYKTNRYFMVKTLRNHKFSFAGLSGGVAVRLSKNGEPEAVGIITGEKPVELEYDKNRNLKNSPCGQPIMTADTIAVTPIESVSELIDYARYSR
ncbi:MAG: hypothetical protein A3J46_02935 [Candidatus Yanofskybacteria bacterium RIFCSPHIGHO2_02_FULL_41_11]|uniref:Uncharacterized protein n=1 Tax=Candidatus Yanofskybacteria bacterium RIFCSPHIGHO2_02_FULL_41_11 TaxID=1802675 RepID=A0A1F8F655_9BACT|nr:MAG: hypothetical protein A3J46_02935 [Candidatus Yanofskybacteria bacterium RIFCSPHIGHO2_02_FULL_41_11]